MNTNGMNTEITINGKKLNVVPIGSISHMQNGVMREIPPTKEWTEYMLSGDNDKPCPEFPPGTKIVSIKNNVKQ